MSGIVFLLFAAFGPPPPFSTSSRAAAKPETRWRASYGEHGVYGVWVWERERQHPAQTPFYVGGGDQEVFFFFTLVTGPRRSLSLKLSDTKVYEPQI